MTVKVYNFAIVLGLVFALSSTLLFEVLPKGSFYYLNSLAFVSYAIALFVKEKKSVGIIRTIELLIVLCALSNLIDETFYDATTLEFNDLIRFLVILYTTHRCRKLLDK